MDKYGPETFKKYSHLPTRMACFHLREVLLAAGIEWQRFRITPDMPGNCLVDCTGIPMLASATFYGITPEEKEHLEAAGLVGDLDWMFLPLPPGHPDFASAMKHIHPRCEEWKKVDADPSLTTLQKNQWKWKHYREIEAKERISLDARAR